MADPDPINLTLKGDGVVLCGERTDGKFIPMRLNNNGTNASASVPSRTPLIATITLTGTAQQLSTAAGHGASTSNAGWRIVVPSGGAGALWGTQASCVSPIAAGGYDSIPSSTLAGWWAKSDGADVVVVLVGGVNS